MPKLTDATVVVNPKTFAPVMLHKGDNLPKWAEGLVGEHLLEADPKPAAKSDKSK